MLSSVVALTIIFSWITLTLVVGVLAGIKRRFSLEGYLVSGRALGLLLLYTLFAAEIYSAYAFLGTAGWAYSYGVPILYAFAYGCVAYAFGYFYAEYVWRAGKRYGYVTQADYFMHRFKSRLLGALTAVIGIVFIIPYLQLQLQGLGYILNVASLGRLSIREAIVVSTIVMLIYVYTSGLRGVAWTNFLQGIFMFVIAWVIVIAIPYKLMGGVGNVFHKLLVEKPGMLYLHEPLGIPWYVSTIILCGLGFFIWPHGWPSIYSSRSLRDLKRTYVILPLYSLFMLPVILAGFTIAAMSVKLSVADEAVMKAVELAYPKWILGLVGAAGFAAAASTASALLLCIAGLTSSNLYKIVREGASDQELVKVSRASVVVYSVITILLAMFAGRRLVPLLLLGYSGITQLFPGAVIGMFWRKASKWSVLAGLTAGLATIVYLKFFGPGNYLGIHFGLWGLIVNLAVFTIASLVLGEDPAFNSFRGSLSLKEASTTS